MILIVRRTDECKGRLGRLLKLVNVLDQEVLDSIESIEDHKGDLSVVFNQSCICCERRLEIHKEKIIRGWEHCGECNVEFEYD